MRSFGLLVVPFAAGVVALSDSAASVALVDRAHALSVRTADSGLLFDDELVSQVRERLGDECGEDDMKAQCLKQFDEIFRFATATTGSAGGEPLSVDHFVKVMTDSAASMTKSYEAKMRNMGAGKLSFLQHKASAKQRAAEFDLGVPCYGGTSCTVLSTVWNACNYGRMLSMMTYQMLNISAHILSVMESLLCACVYAPVVPGGRCFMPSRALYVGCGSVAITAKTMWSGTTSVWESVKGATRRCNVHNPAAVAAASALR